VPNSLDRFILLPLNGKTLQISPHFKLLHPAMVVPPGGVERRLDMGTQLETFSYLTLSKPLLSSNAFWAKSFSQTLKKTHNAKIP